MKRDIQMMTLIHHS